MKNTRAQVDAYYAEIAAYKQRPPSDQELAVTRVLRQQEERERKTEERRNTPSQKEG